MIWGGSVWTRAQLDAGEVPRCSFSFVDEDVLLAAPADGLDYFVNHSCDPSGHFLPYIERRFRSASKA